MAFTTQTKIHLNNAHVSTCLDDTLNLSGSTYFGTRAEYLTGMSTNCNGKTIPDVDFVTGLTSQAITDADNGLTKVGDTVILGGTLTGATTIDTNTNTITITNGESAETKFVLSTSEIDLFSDGGLIDLDSNNINIDFSESAIITDNGSTPSGLTYAADYSTTFVDNSLITKKYVDDLITASAITASNGLTLTDNDVQLGGALITSTTISGGTGTTHNTLSLGDADSMLVDFNVYACNDVYVCGIKSVCLTTCGSDATILLDNVSNDVKITATESVCLNGISGIELFGETCLITDPLAGSSTDSVLVRAGDSSIRQVSFATITGDTYSKACIDAYTGATDTRIETIETTFITGGTEGLTKVGQDLCLGGELSQVGSGIISDSRTDTVGIIYGGDYEADFVARSLVTKQYVTGLTSNSYTKAQIDAYTGATDTRLDGIEADITYISGQTNLKLNTSVYAAYTASTETRLDTIEEDYVTGATDGIYKTDCHTVSLTTANQAILTGALTGVTGTHLGTSGRNVCLDATAVCIVNNALTGSTNGLTDDGRTVKLGGTLTETTTIVGSEILNINVNELNLSGNTTGINLTGEVRLKTTPATFNGDVLTFDPSDGSISKTTLSSLGGLTGATNGLDVDGQDVILGGVLTKDTVISGDTYDLSLGIASSKLDTFNVNTSGDINVTSDANLVMSLSGGTIATSDLKGLRYTTDYSTTFVDNSLVTKLYVDTVASGLDPKSAVFVATTTGQNLDLSGVETIDGITTTDGMRVLVKNQTNASENGIYIASASTWVRASDFDGTPEGEVTEGALIPVLSGSTNINSSWILITKDPITVGTSDLVFTKFSQLLDVSAGDGIRIDTAGETKEINVELASNSGLEFSSGDLKIDLADNSGLQLLSTGLTVNPAIAGNALDWSAGVLNVNVSDVNTQLGGVLSGSTNGLTDTNGVVSLGGTLTQATTITGNDVCTLTYSDSAVTDKRGILYAADYCATFIDRSLVDKAYVVRYTTGLTSGLDSRIDLLESWSATTETRVDNLETDVTALGAVSGITLQSITGVTNGLTKVGTHSAKLGGTLNTGTTTITIPNDGLTVLDFVHGGSCLRFEGEAIGICNDNWELTVDGNTNAVYLGKTTASYGLFDGGGVYFSSTGGSAIRICSGDVHIYGTPILENVNYDVAFNSEEDGILFRDSSDGNSVHLVTLDALISGITTTAITGATNGLTKVGQNAKLGGTLCESTNIYLAGNEFYVNSGTTGDFLFYLSENGSLLASAKGAELAVEGNSVGFITSTISGGFDGDTNAVMVVANDCDYMRIDGLADSINFTTTGGTHMLLQGANDARLYISNNAGLIIDNTAMGLSTGDVAGIIMLDSTGGLNTGVTTGVVNVYGHTKLLTVPATGTTSDWVLVRDNTGEIQQIAVSAITGTLSVPVTGATNGLGVVNKNVELGGTLTKNTTIDMGTPPRSLTICGGTDPAYLRVNGSGTGSVEIGSNDVHFAVLSGSGLMMYSGTTTVQIIQDKIELTGTVDLVNAPATGTTSDWVLVRASDGTVKQIDPANLGEDNNDYSMTVVAASTGLTTGSTYAILVNSPTAAVTLTLPATPFDGQAFRFKDAGGQALTYNITISGNGNNIDGDPTAVINTDYGALELVFNASLDKWLVLSFVN